MTNAKENACFFSFDKIVNKESPGSFSMFLSFEDIPQIASIYSYRMFFEAIMNMKQKNRTF